MLKFINQNQRKQAVTPLEQAVSRNDCAVITKILDQAQFVPTYLFEYAAACGQVEAFDCLLNLFSTIKADDLISDIFQKTRVTHAALMSNQFMMFKHLVFSHKCHFSLQSGFEAYIQYNNKELLHFLLTTCFDVRTGFKAYSPLQGMPTFYGCNMYYADKNTDDPSPSLLKDVFNQLLHFEAVIDLESLKYILDHPQCPDSFHRKLVYHHSVLSTVVFSKLDMLQYMNERYNLKHMFCEDELKKVASAYQSSPDLLFSIALCFDAFDCCEELLRIGIHPTPQCWKELTASAHLVDFDLVQRYKYLYSLHVPFYHPNEEYDFSSPYLLACNEYVKNGNRELLDTLLIIQMPICFNSPDLVRRPITKLLKDIRTGIVAKGEGVERVIICYTCYTNSTVTYSTYERLTECIDLLISLGCTCDWSSLLTDDPDVMRLKIITKFKALPTEYIWLRIIDNHHDFNLDVVLYCLVNYTYRLTPERVQKALDKLNLELFYPSSPMSAYNKLVLNFWYDDLTFRQFALQMMSPIRVIDSVTYPGIEASDCKMFQHFEKYCKQVQAVCEEAVSVIQQCKLGVIDDVVSNIVCAYL